MKQEIFKKNQQNIEFFLWTKEQEKLKDTTKVWEKINIKKKEIERLQIDIKRLTTLTIIQDNNKLRGELNNK